VTSEVLGAVRVERHGVAHHSHHYFQIDRDKLQRRGLQNVFRNGIIIVPDSDIGEFSPFFTSMRMWLELADISPSEKCFFGQIIEILYLSLHELLLITHPQWDPASRIEPLMETVSDNQDGLIELTIEPTKTALPQLLGLRPIEGLLQSEDITLGQWALDLNIGIGVQSALDLYRLQAVPGVNLPEQYGNFLLGFLRHTISIGFEGLVLGVAKGDYTQERLYTAWDALALDIGSQIKDVEDPADLVDD